MHLIFHAWFQLYQFNLQIADCVFSEKIALSGCRYVDVGDQGVNDARWFRNDAVLVTASGNGRCVNLDLTEIVMLDIGY